MKVIKSFYSNSRKKTFNIGDDIKNPMKEWIKEGLVEEPKKKKVLEPNLKNKPNARSDKGV